MAQAAAASSAINPKLIVPFINSVKSVFTTMVNVPVTMDRPFVGTNPGPTHDVSTIVGFSGDVIGNVVVTFERAAAIALVKSFTGTEMEFGSPDFADAIGELANMVVGAAKKDLGTAASISTPSVVVGNGHSLARLSDVPTIVLPVKTPVGDFAVEISIKQIKAAAA